MKLKKIHMFLILLLSLTFCCVGFSVFEGNENMDDKDKKSTHEGKGESGSSTQRMGRRDRLKNAKVIHDYDPFGNDPKKKNEKEDEEDNKNLKGMLKFITGKDGQVEKIPSKDDDDEELYVLKSQIVPPVCPKCPDVKKCDTNKDCPACPAPKRCPPKPFECKMVPKWADPRLSKQEPKPVLNSFDTFA